MTTRSGYAERSTVCRFTRLGMYPPLAGEREANVVRLGGTFVADVDGVEAAASGAAIAPDLHRLVHAHVRAHIRGVRHVASGVFAPVLAAGGQDVAADAARPVLPASVFHDLELVAD